MRFQGLTREILFLAPVVALLCVCSPLMAQVYTTTEAGLQVNANIYLTKDAVYLSGGPTNFPGCNQKGLTQGTYYFQITNPSGSLLLSTDSLGERKVGVDPGANVITDYLGSTHNVSLTTSPCGSSLVQLSPYNDTTNPGGEYKLWLFGPGCSFANGYSDATIGVDLGVALTGCSNKTDNFKVRQGSECNGGCPSERAITGVKYFDLNANGQRDGGEVTIQGWQIVYTIDNWATSNSTFTDSSGAWGIVLPEGTTFTACEVLPVTGNYIQTGPLVGASAPPATAGTVTSRGVCWTGTVGGSDINNLDFGNICLGAGGGKTLGFWSNKNGQAILSAHDTDWRDDLNLLHLRNAGGGNYDVPGGAFAPAYTNFRTWLLNADAVNMSYMLSAQLAAMALNTEPYGSVNPSAILFAGAKPAGCAEPPLTGIGFISVSALMSSADYELGIAGYTPAGDPERACQEFKKNVLDAANNNKNFVQTEPCPFSYGQ